MNSHYTYLVLDVVLLAFPLALSFNKKVAFYQSWKFLFISIFVSSAFFILCDIFFTSQGIKQVNQDFMLGINIVNLPLEEVLFLFCISFFCLFIYEVFNAYVKRDVLGTCGTRVSILFSVLCVITGVLFYDRMMTLVYALICLVLILYGTFIYRFRNLGRFYLSFAVSLIPFLIYHALMSDLHILIFDNNEIMNIRLGTIPLEQVFLCLGLMLSTVLILDNIKERAEEKNM